MAHLELPHRFSHKIYVPFNNPFSQRTTKEPSSNSFKVIEGPFFRSQII